MKIIGEISIDQVILIVNKKVIVCNEIIIILNNKL